jgi:hypothetical protein
MNQIREQPSTPKRARARPEIEDENAPRFTTIKRLAAELRSKIDQRSQVALARWGSERRSR